MAERGLLLPTKSQLTACENAMTVSSSDLPPASFPGWEAVAKQYAKILLAELAVELQDKNDCQGNALATGEEARQRLSTGAMRQFARTYAYNASEAIDTGMRSVGADRGSTITAGVQLLTKGLPSIGVPPGLPLETDWQYNTYERSFSRFAERAKGALIVPSSVANHGPAPTADQLPLVCAVGGSVHGGVYWSPRFSRKTVDGRQWKLWTNAPGNGGGHALAFGVCVKWLEEEKAFWPVIWNSHGDGPILMPPEVWDKYAKQQFRPFGGFVMLPEKPEEQWHDRRKSGGGYV